MAGRTRRGCGQVTVINPADPDGGAAVGEPARPRARLPGAGAHRHGAGAVPGRLRRATSRSRRSCRRRCSGSTRPAAGIVVTGAGRPGAACAAGRPDPGAAAAGRAGGDRGGRLRPGAAGRRPRLRRRAAAVAADRLGGPVLRGRPPGRHRGAAAPQRGARDRGRGQRRGQGVPDRHADHPDRRAPAAAGQGGGPRPDCGTSSSSRRRTGCCAPAGRAPARTRSSCSPAMLAEIRAYGEGIVVAEQIPAKLVPDVVKNTALKVVHRLPAQDDRQLVGAAMNLDEDQSRQVVSLRPGVAAVFADGMDRPLRIRVPFGGDRERAAAAGRSRPPIGHAAAARRPAARRALDGRACTLRRAPGGRPARRLARVMPGCGSGPRRSVLALPDQPAAAAGAGGAAAALGRAGPRGCASACWRPCSTGRCRPGAAAADLLQTRADLAAACAEHRAPACWRGGRVRARCPARSWVIPQLRWLHEMERACPLTAAAARPVRAWRRRSTTRCPAWRTGRTSGSGSGSAGCAATRCRWSCPRNRLLAWTALLGEDDQRGFIEDLAAVAIGVEPSRPAAPGRGRDGRRRLAGSRCCPGRAGSSSAQTIRRACSRATEPAPVGRIASARHGQASAARAPRHDASAARRAGSPA